MRGSLRKKAAPFSVEGPGTAACSSSKFFCNLFQQIRKRLRLAHHGIVACRDPRDRPALGLCPGQCDFCRWIRRVSAFDVMGRKTVSDRVLQVQCRGEGPERVRCQTRLQKGNVVRLRYAKTFRRGWWQRQATAAGFRQLPAVFGKILRQRSNQVSPLSSMIASR